MASSDEKKVVKHVVKRGDSLSIIAKGYGVKVPEIIGWNPNLKKNPDNILPGDELKVVVLKISKHVALIKFNGRNLTIDFTSRSLKSLVMKAKSGLPKGAPRIKELVEGGRKDIELSVDYQSSRYQKVKDAGPIPSADYTLKLKKGMKFDKTGKGWGAGGWLLKESLLGRLDDFFGGRNGFFLHEDGGHPGTAGCIGLQKKGDIKRVQRILSEAFDEGQKRVVIRVRY